MKNIEFKDLRLFWTQLDKKGIAVEALAFLSVLLLCFFIIQGVKNRAISYEESIKQAYSNIKSAEKRRSDLIPNLVECVRAYSEYEYRTTLAIVEARYGNVNIDSIARSGDGDLISREVKDKISIVVEHYPNLKAQKNYQNLMRELSLTENKILRERITYNKQVTSYKSFVRQFPSKQLLSLAGYDVMDCERLEFEDISM